MLGGMMQSIGVGGTVEASELNPNLGDVTINNSTPELRMKVTDDAQSGRIHFQNLAGTNKGSIFYGQSGYNPSDAMQFLTNSAIRMTIDNTGNVGIGETSPDYKLDVNGSFGFTPGASVAPVDNGDVVIEATNNTTLTFKLKGTDATIRTGTLTLS